MIWCPMMYDVKHITHYKRGLLTGFHLMDPRPKGILRSNIITSHEDCFILLTAQKLKL
jgi:hypothetical protein